MHFVISFHFHFPSPCDAFFCCYSVHVTTLRKIIRNQQKYFLHGASLTHTHTFDAKRSYELVMRFECFYFYFILFFVVVASSWHDNALCLCALCDFCHWKNNRKMASKWRREGANEKKNGIEKVCRNGRIVRSTVYHVWRRCDDCHCIWADNPGITVWMPRELRFALTMKRTQKAQQMPSEKDEM